MLFQRPWDKITPHKATRYTTGTLSEYLKILIMTENELATIAVGICYKIHTTLGPGLLESVYEAAFAYELNKRGISFTRQQGILVKV